MGMIYGDMERIKRFLRERSRLKKINPEFTPKCKLDFTTTPEMLGLVKGKYK